MKYIIIDLVKDQQLTWDQDIDRIFDTFDEAARVLHSNPDFERCHDIRGYGEDKHVFDIEGEDIDGDYIQFEFEGTIEEARNECYKTLDWVGGGHLDIFLVEGQFIEDFEL